ncbi:MAG: phenylacetic acid degradation protein PaaN [Bacteroidetes bacterium]|nr:phenylacetic acid degradation protein PaaN [bacterium]NBP64199.1 phenylacetic acid degradation protein PaaN [Bacteroidota bacterium]
MSFHHLFEQHASTLNAAVEANRNRLFHAHWPEPPSGKIYGETAQEEGLQAFKAALNNAFDFPHQKGSEGTVGAEHSPFGFPLNISYPAYSADVLIANANESLKQWKKLTVTERAGILIECLERASKHFFAIGFSTMHTTGQGFIMGFQASGPHAFDRALESIATGYMALDAFASSAHWTKPMGKMQVDLKKEYHVRPKGINLTIGCSTFPIWNSFPGMFASLITGNVTIAKTHPSAILPLAICIQSFQETLASLGLDPHIIQIAIDSQEKPLTLALAEQKDIQTIDYTGSSAFGNQLEKLIAGSTKELFTEKAGVNCALIGEVNNLDAVLDNIAFSLCLYSGQMCTTTQNIYVPKSGVITPEGIISFDDICLKLKEKVDALVFNEKMGPGTLGALHSPAVKSRIEKAKASGLIIIRDSESVSQQGFDNALSCSPLILKADSAHQEIVHEEWFGPISFMIPVEDISTGIKVMADSIKQHGALTALLHLNDEGLMNQAVDQLVDAGVNISFNLVGPIWVNQSAGFSDFHGTGANPAGNASFADLSFVSRRYNIIGMRRP